ncbi:MAG: class I SAM-dependent methyltransferase [Acetatifactor sp.]|nr:class I SAM-dependent methyltransferase [Acetatifactor sp.]
MKLLIYIDDNLKQTEFFIDYMRKVVPELMPDVLLTDNSHSTETNKWASVQSDFTYIYFEEKTTCGSALNQVIEGLEIDDDILITDSYHIPLAESYNRMLDALSKEDNSFAIGPLSNSFKWEQHAEWSDAEAALDWTEATVDYKTEEVLMLQTGVILFGRNVVHGSDTFYDDARDMDNLIVEKCVREHLNHLKMYVCCNSGFYDVRGKGYQLTLHADIDMLEKEFGIHYLNVRGNDWLLSLLEKCEDLKDDIRVLEVGCDCGGTLFGIKKLYKNAQLYGTDINKGAIRFASEFAEVKVNNIEDHNLDFGRNDFDVIVFGDVLEHLRDPLGTLIFCKKLLKKGGRIVTSIPNLMNIGVMKQLLDGNFTYSEIGLLDKTHIHMFTYNEIIRMFVHDAGYQIEKITMNGSFNDEEEKLADELVKLGNAEKFMYRAFQYQVVARL